MTRAHTHVIGLTGGIGSGKSTVAGYLAEWGATVLDADRMAKALTQPGGLAIEPIQQAFGDAFITEEGALNRDAMRQAVFADAQARQRLEAITHPLIGQQIQAALRSAPPGVVVLDIPLLVESGRWPGQLDAVVVVDCSVATQVHRVGQRNGWTQETTLAIIHSQASRETRLAHADAVVCNDDISLPELRAQVQGWCHWLGL